MRSLERDMIDSLLLQEFVRGCRGYWSPGDWIGLMLKLKWSGFGRVSERRVRALVTENRDWWLQGKNTIPKERRTDKRRSPRARKISARRSRKPK